VGNLNTHKTLILNSTFKPLSLATPKRALALLFSKKINVLKNSDIRLRSVEQSIAIPKVAVLTYYVKAPYARRVALNRENIFIRDSYLCQYCGDDAESIDHIMPKSKGGSHEWGNVVACCKRCNLLKADKLLGKTSLHLQKAPTIPGGNFWIKTIIGNNPDPEWKEYLILT
jgi:5-methylcytosine-specific restriction endonuclease McrA